MSESGHDLAHTEEVAIAQIVVPEGRRPVGNLQGLESSIREIGLLNPITITPDDRLLAGRNRLEACRALGWETIPANRLPLSGLRAQLAEIDENLIRNDLTVLERGEQLIRRKQVYEALHPEARAHVAGAHASNRAQGRDASESISPAFAGDTAAKTNVTPRTVQQEVQIAARIPEDVKEQIRETPVADNKTELLKLARLPEGQQREVATRLAANPKEKVATAARKTSAACSGPVCTPEPVAIPEAGAPPAPSPAAGSCSQLPAGPFGVIVADPPWRYNNSGCRGAAEDQYRTMSLDDIRALPVGEIAAKDCALFLWATWPQLPEAFSVMAAWGFAYVTGFPWVKIVGRPSTDLWGELDIKPQYGVGFWFRGCTEIVLVGRRGSVSPPSNGFVGLLSENFKHSRKPDNIHHIAEALPGPHLELFCRRPRQGWTVWGNEVTDAANN